ncbi:MAG: RNA methyltransferase [Planctomycetota bacterium]|nr:RNA methyltransferase [Planctomycetota bacterium]
MAVDSRQAVHAMMPIFIESLHDERLDVYRQLKKSNLTRWSKRFIAEGDKVVLRLLQSDFAIESILTTDRYLEEVTAALVSRSARHAGDREQISVFIVPEGLLPQIVGFNFHRGMLACGTRKAGTRLEDFCLPIDRSLRLVVCADVQGPDNLGVILRTASALGVQGVVLGPGAGDPFSRRVLRVSMGSALSLPIYESSDLAADLTRLCTEFQVQCIATVLDNSATPLHALTPFLRMAVVFGNEGHGLDAAIVSRCQQRVFIPMERGVDSLNVAVAAGIFLYELGRSV